MKIHNHRAAGLVAGLLAVSALAGCKGNGNGKDGDDGHPLVGSTWLCNFDEQIEFQPKTALRYEEGRAETAEVQYPSPDRVTIVESGNKALAFTVKIADDTLELKDIADGDVLECSRTDAVIPYKELKEKVCADACDEMLKRFKADGGFWGGQYKQINARDLIGVVRQECLAACSGGRFASCIARSTNAEEMAGRCYTPGVLPRAQFDLRIRAYKDKFCRESKECKQSGQCHPTASFLSMEPAELKRPEPLGPMALMHCEPKSDADCAASAGCKSYGACKLKSDFGGRNDCQSGR